MTTIENPYIILIGVRKNNNSEEVHEVLGAAIGDYMKENGYTQTYVARKIGVSRDAISRILCGKRKLSVEEYCDICCVLGVPFEHFLNEERGTSETHTTLNVL